MPGVIRRRKIWIHARCEASVPKVAAILSVIEASKRLGIQVRDYRIAVLPGLEAKKRNHVAILTPEA